MAQQYNKTSFDRLRVFTQFIKLGYWLLKIIKLFINLRF